MGNAISLAKIGHVLLGLREKIAHLWVYDHRDLILPYCPSSSAAAAKASFGPGKHVPSSSSPSVARNTSGDTLLSHGGHEEEREAVAGAGSGLVVFSYNINCLFAHHNPAQLLGIVAYFSALFQLPARPTPVPPRSGPSPAEQRGRAATGNYIKKGMQYAPDLVCLQEAWEEVLVNTLLRLGAQHGWHAARPATVKRLLVGEHSGRWGGSLWVGA